MDVNSMTLEQKIGMLISQSQMHAIDILKGTIAPKGTLPFDVELQ